MNAAAHEAPRPDHPVSLLIVDDVSDTREMYAFYFRKQGFTVFTALDGRNGLDVVMAKRPDVIVMDLSMPGMDGLTLTRTLKRDARVRHIPIIILTGYPMRAVQDGVLEAGADGFLTKPCLPDELEQHVRRVLDAGPPRSR